MLQSQKLKLEMSKARERLAAFSKKDDLTEGETAEMQELSDGYTGLEERYRAALISENVEDERDAAETEPDSEERELFQLESKASLSNYIRAAMGEITLGGEESEFKAAMKAADGQIPLAAITPHDEMVSDEKYADSV